MTDRVGSSGAQHRGWLPNPRHAFVDGVSYSGKDSRINQETLRNEQAVIL